MLDAALLPTPFTASLGHGLQHPFQAILTDPDQTSARLIQVERHVDNQRHENKKRILGSSARCQRAAPDRGGFSDRGLGAECQDLIGGRGGEQVHRPRDDSRPSGLVTGA
jgi:hypothetical protein